MVNHPEAVDMVETCVREREPILSICQFETAWDAEKTKAFRRELDRDRGEIHADVSSPMLCEFEAVSRDSAPNLQDVLAPESGEVRDRWHMPFPVSESLSG